MSRVFRAVDAIGQDNVVRYGESDPERVELPLRDVPERITDLCEVELGLPPEDALLEADRCLRC